MGKSKEKCKKFPYCNQGDINALNITENKIVKDAIKNVADKIDINENIIIAILEYEYKKLNKRYL
jgi:AAA+ ATPase superfamily predicted ATPase